MDHIKSPSRNGDVLVYIKSTQRRQSGLKSGGSWRRFQNFDFLGKFPKNFDFFQQFHELKIDFFRRNFRKNSIFLQVILQKVSFFQGKFPKNFDFLGYLTKKFNFITISEK